MTRVIVAVALLAGVFAAPARADREARARQLYGEGEKAYQANDYQRAYDDFKQAYVLSQEPALLYDVASALQGLGRPHDAAEALRTYLKQVPNDPDRPKIEKRIAGLEDAQRLLDLEKKPAPPPEPLPAAPKAVAPAVPPAALSSTVEMQEARSKRRRNIAIIATVVSVVVAGAAVGLGIAFAPHSTEPPTRSDLGPVMGTP